MKYIVTWNAGSSSLKVTVAERRTLRRVGEIAIERIGLPGSMARIRFDQRPASKLAAKVATPAAAARLALDVMGSQGINRADIAACVYRIVFGGHYRQAVHLNNRVIAEIRRYQNRAPLHLPAELEVIAVVRRLAGAAHFACFDTSFFTRLPETATTLPIDRRVARHLQLSRHGFHGLSHAAADASAARALGRRGSVVTIHLGSGCSMAAIRRGRPIETSMGLTPSEGLMMGTRSGDVDPGLLLDLLRRGLSVKQVSVILEQQSGLLGISGYSSDLRDILVASGHPVVGYRPPRKPTLAQRRDSRLALAMFVWRIRKYLAAYAALLGRVDAVVFTGAAGERNPQLRRLVMSGLTLPGRPKIVVAATDEAGEMLRQVRPLIR